MNPIISNNSDLQDNLRRIITMHDRIISSKLNKIIININDAIGMIIDKFKNTKLERIIIGIGGFPGSGKTTLAREIVEKIDDECGRRCAAYLSMDGFHYSNAVLESKGLADVKGDITTYDVERYLEKLKEFKASTGSIMYAPDYIREQHDVFENMIEIQSGVGILITEGIYVGYSGGKWEEVGRVLDMLFYLDASPEQCVDRITARNLQVGRTTKEIDSKLANDFRLMEKSIQGFEKSDFVIKSV